MPTASLRFADPEGLEHELRVGESGDAPLIADHPEVPRELALQGFDSVRAYSARPGASEGLLEALDFERRDGSVGGARRASAAASSPTTRRRPTAACRAPGRSTTSPGPRQMEEHERVARGGDGGRRAPDRR